MNLLHQFLRPGLLTLVVRRFGRCGGVRQLRYYSNKALVERKPEPETFKDTYNPEPETFRETYNAVQVAERVNPAVVLVIARYIVEDEECSSSGTGSIIHKDGLVLTCAHIFNSVPVYGCKIININLSDGRSYKGNVVILDRSHDICLIQIFDPNPFPILKLGKSLCLKQGQTVTAMGFPVGDTSSLCRGIISCPRRPLKLERHKGYALDYIQTDCLVNKGNSGGPLLNHAGEMVGMILFGWGKMVGINFAFPIQTIMKIIKKKKNSLDSDSDSDSDSM